MKSKIYLVRHGQTEWNINLRHTSFTDLPLNETGIEQAKGLKPYFSKATYSHVFASPMQRAIQTCEYAGCNKNMKILEDLREWNYGEYEGKTGKEIRQEKPNWNIAIDGPKGGETPHEIELRAKRLIEKLSKLEGDILLFTHGHFSKVFGATWIGMGVKGSSKLHKENAALSILGYEKDEPAILSWNISLYRLNGV